MDWDDWPDWDDGPVMVECDECGETYNIDENPDACPYCGAET